MWLSFGCAYDNSSLQYISMTRYRYQQLYTQRLIESEGPEGSDTPFPPLPQPHTLTHSHLFRLFLTTGLTLEFVQRQYHRC